MTGPGCTGGLYAPVALCPYSFPALTGKIHIIVQTVIIATVAIQSFHIPKYPISIKATTLPTTSFQLLDPNQANPASTNNIIGHGVANSNFSIISHKNLLLSVLCCCQIAKYKNTEKINDLDLKKPTYTTS